VIDLMKMTAVRIDPEKKLAFSQAGADGGDVDHEAALHNLACITGTVSHTGFAGVALGGGALVRQDTHLPCTAMQAALDGCFPFNNNYRDKGVFTDWDPGDTNAVNEIVAIATKCWSEKPSFASKLSAFLLFMEVNGAVGKAAPSSTSFSARNGRLWCSALTGWSDDDPKRRAACKQWCDAFVAALGPFHVTTYVNNAMPESESEMRGVFPEETIKRLAVLKTKHDPGNMFKMGAWARAAGRCCRIRGTPFVRCSRR